MSSKFRKNATKYNYTVRSLLRRMLRYGLTCLLMVTCISTLVAFYIMIDYQVVQSITLGHMKNLQIYSKSIKYIKENDLEMIGNDLVVSAKQISDIISRPLTVTDPDYELVKDNYISEAYAKAGCKSKECKNVY